LLTDTAAIRDGRVAVNVKRGEGRWKIKRELLTGLFLRREWGRATTLPHAGPGSWTRLPAKKSAPRFLRGEHHRGKEKIGQKPLSVNGMACLLEERVGGILGFGGCGEPKRRGRCEAFLGYYRKPKERKTTLHSLKFNKRTKTHREGLNGITRVQNQITVWKGGKE